MVRQSVNDARGNIPPVINGLQLFSKLDDAIDLLVSSTAMRGMAHDIVEQRIRGDLAVAPASRPRFCGIEKRAPDAVMTHIRVETMLRYSLQDS